MFVEGSTVSRSDVSEASMSSPSLLKEASVMNVDLELARTGVGPERGIA